MKKIFTLLSVFISLYSSAQTLCGTSNEGGTVTLTAPAGKIFISIQFASYGTPNGSCGSFTIGACDAANSMSICSTALVGRNSASVGANNGVFGDPCGGTPKRLYIEAVYGFALPLRLVSFTAQKMSAGTIRLNWSSDHEQNSSHFIIERSENGILFENSGTVNAAGSGSNHYSFINSIDGNKPVYFYRLKIVDIDGRYEYSSIVRVETKETNLSLLTYPSPANNMLTVISNKKTEGTVTNNTGQAIKNLSLINGSQTINIADWPQGTYFIVTPGGVTRFVKM